MAIEGKDFDDAAIMQATTQEPGDKDTFRLRLKLPLSGRELTSEWIRQDQRRQALFAWVETVRSEAQSDIAAFESDRKAKALAQRARAMAAEVLPAPPAPEAPPQEAATALTTSPDDYITEQLKLATIREASALQEAVAAESKHKEAVHNLEKWRKLAAALGPSASG